MTNGEFQDIFDDVFDNIRRARQTQLTVVICGPAEPSGQPIASPGPRTSVRNSLNSDRVYFLEELVASDAGREASRQLEDDLGNPPTLDQIEKMILKGEAIDKDVHIVEDVGAVAELIYFVGDENIFKKMYAFVNSRYRGSESFLNQSAYRKLIEDNRLFWFNDIPDLKAKVKNALVRNRILKSDLL